MTRPALPAGPGTREDETGCPIVTGRPLVVEQGGALAALGDIYNSIGNKAMAKAMRRTSAILEELHDLGAEEVRSRLGTKPGPAVSSVC